MGYKTGMRARGLGLAVAGAVALAGCADDAGDGGTPAAGMVNPERGPTTIPVVPPEPGLEVRLLDPGAEPRAPLRLAPTVGDAYDLVYETSFAMTLDMNEHRMLAIDEQSHAVLGLRVAAVDADGNATIELLVRELADPMYDPSKPTAASTRSLVGERGSFVVDPRGRVVSTDLPFLAGVGADAAEILNLPDHLVALPDEPVGLGASWEIRSTAVRRGLTVHNVDVHRLVARTGATVRTELTQRHDCPPQLMLEAARDPYTQLSIRDYEGGGSGAIELSLDRVLPRANTLAFDVTAKMQFHSPGMAGDMGMKMKVAIRGEAR
jgi:hypothetical protein